MTDNMDLWNKYGVTDPRHTKEVGFGRKFTAIDAYYQIMRATEAFGPFGQGWGWDSEEDVVVAVGPNGKTSTLAKVKLTLWYRPKPEATVATTGPVIAMNLLVSSKDVPDEEAFKKATTDALTKALSYLGFSADVFMGKFDDNRYVAALKESFSKADVAKAAELPPAVKQAVANLKGIPSIEGLSAEWLAIKPEYDKLAPAQQAYVRLQWTRRKDELSPQE